MILAWNRRQNVKIITFCSDYLQGWRVCQTESDIFNEFAPSALDQTAFMWQTCHFHLRFRFRFCWFRGIMETQLLSWGTKFQFIVFKYLSFPPSPLSKMPRQPAVGTSLRGRAVQVRQEGLCGEVVHPAGPGERRAGPQCRDADPPRRSHAHPHLPPALEQPGWHGPRLAQRPAHLPQAAYRVPGLLPGPGRSQWERVGGATATAGSWSGLQSEGSSKRSPVHHRRRSARTRSEFWWLILNNAHFRLFRKAIFFQTT